MDNDLDIDNNELRTFYRHLRLLRYMITIEHIKNILTTWAIAPLSDKISRALADVAWSYLTPGNQIIELGSGTGNITQYLVKYNDVSLTCFEILPEFVEHLEQEFADHDHVQILDVWAQELDKYFDPDSVDVIISTIPMTFLEDDIDQILGHISSILRPGGVFVSGQVRSVQNKLIQEYVWDQIYSKRIMWLQPIHITAYENR